MHKFQTLMQREWMQHQRGWLLMMLLPPALIFLIVLFGPADSMSVVFDGQRADATSVPVLLLLTSTVVVTFMVLCISWIAVTFQAPGQARRDHQDRSIEFWLSLPVSHSASIGAMVLVQLFAVPLLALALGWFGSQIIGLAAVARYDGASAWFSLPWGALLAANLALLARLGLGIVLATLWFLPLLLLSMVASAWLRRWGMPALIAAVVGSGLVLKQLYGVNWVFDTLGGLMSYGSRALLHIDRSKGPGIVIHGPEDVLPQLARLPVMLMNDGLAALRDCAQPLFLGALLFSACCFALLVLRRRRVT